MLASLFARVASPSDAEYSCPYEIASHLWVGHVPFRLPSTEGKFDSEEFMVGLWFVRLSCALLVATALTCAVVLCLCTQLPVGTGDVILDKIELSPSFRVQASGSWHCVVRYNAIWMALVCVGLAGLATVMLGGFFSLMKALVRRFQVFVSLAALLVALIVAIVGLAHEFSCVGFAHAYAQQQHVHWRL